MDEHVRLLPSLAQPPYPNIEPYNPDMLSPHEDIIMTETEKTTDCCDECYDKCCAYNDCSEWCDCLCCNFSHADNTNRCGCSKEDCDCICNCLEVVARCLEVAVLCLPRT
jgi:hypothetical protein